MSIVVISLTAATSAVDARCAFTPTAQHCTRLCHAVWHSAVPLLVGTGNGH